LPLGAAIFLASFLYVWLRVEPAFEYQHLGPYFLRQPAFARTFLAQPGGLVNYVGVFLAQLNCVNWLGALVFVLCQGAVFVAALFCLERLGGWGPGFAALVPAYVLLLLRNGYGRPVAALSIGLVLALGALALHVSAPWRRQWLLVVGSGLISALLFWLAGIWSALLFAVLCGLFVVVQRRRWLAGLSCVALGLAAPLAVFGAGDLGMAELMSPWPSGASWTLVAALYACVPIAGAILAWSGVRHTRSGRARPRAQPSSEAPGAEKPDPLAGGDTAAPGDGRAPGPGGVDAVALEDGRPPSAAPADPVYGAARCGRAGRMVVLAFLLGGAAVWLTFDRREKLLAEMDYGITCGRYEAVLAAARQVRALDHPGKVRLLLALYHTGRLAEELFSFHDMVADGPMAGIGEDCRAQSQALFELGLINDAEHMAHEALELEGERPDVLRLLARINLLKGRPAAAQLFLNVLSLIPFQGEHADAAWPLPDPHSLAQDTALADRMRGQALTSDVVHDRLPVAPLLDVLLASHPTNRMAFEYAMAYYLLDLDLPKAVARLRSLDHFNYPRLPRPYEEARAFYELAAGAQAAHKGREVRPETAARLLKFTEAARKAAESGGDQVALAKKFGDTYWYYYYAVRRRQRAAEEQAAGP
jgi:hypothetical protein